MSPPHRRPFQTLNFQPDFDVECRVCGATPTVNIPEHPVPSTGLCGTHFFSDRTMSDWNDWNDQPEDTE